MTVLTAVTDALKYLWEYHDQIGIFFNFGCLRLGWAI